LAHRACRPSSRCSRTPARWGRLAAVSLLTELDAFYPENRRYGELELGRGGVMKGRAHPDMDDDKPRSGSWSSGEVRLGPLRITAERIGTSSALVAGLLTAVAAMYSVYSGFTKLDAEKQLRPAVETRRFVEQQQFLAAKVSETQTQIQLLQAEVRKLTTVPEGTQVAAQLGRLDKTVDGVAERLRKLEVVILNDPAKALEMPLLRNDLDSTKKDISLRFWR